MIIDDMYFRWDVKEDGSDDFNSVVVIGDELIMFQFVVDGFLVVEIIVLYVIGIGKIDCSFCYSYGFLLDVKII